MNEDNARARILLIVKDMTGEECTGDTKLASLGIDSLERVDLVMRIESEFNVMIPDEDAMIAEKISDLVTAVCEQCVKNKRS